MGADVAGSGSPGREFLRSLPAERAAPFENDWVGRSLMEGEAGTPTYGGYALPAAAGTRSPSRYAWYLFSLPLDPRVTRFLRRISGNRYAGFKICAASQGSSAPAIVTRRSSASRK